MFSRPSLASDLSTELRECVAGVLLYWHDMIYWRLYGRPVGDLTNPQTWPN
jgi:hypothetical protein